MDTNQPTKKLTVAFLCHECWRRKPGVCGGHSRNEQSKPCQPSSQTHPSGWHSPVCGDRICCFMGLQDCLT